MTQNIQISEPMNDGRGSAEAMSLDTLFGMIAQEAARFRGAARTGRQRPDHTYANSSLLSRSRCRR